MTSTRSTKLSKSQVTFRDLTFLIFHTYNIHNNVEKFIVNNKRRTHLQELQQIKRGLKDTITTITDETIERIPKVRLFNNKEMDLKLYNFHKELLNISMKKNNCNEVGLFSGADLKSFVDYVSIYAMTAVCNDGTIYTINKTSEFDPIALMMYYNSGIEKGGEYSGIKNVARNASKIGIKYKCSIKRRN